MTDSTLQLLAARAHIAAGRLRSAERALQTIVGRPAAPAEAQHMLARVRADLVRHGALGEARPEASRDINADFVRAVEAAKQGKVEEAIRLYRNVIAAAPKLAQAYSNLGTLYRDQNRLNEAIETYRAGIRAAPNFPALHYNIGFALLGQRKHEEARDAYGRALALKPDWPQTYYNLGIIAQETQQYAEAVEFYQQCLALDPNNRHCANNMGNSLMALGRVDDAIVAFGRAVDLAPTTNKANAAAGASAGDPFEVGEPISEPDGHANARFNRALAYLVKGDYTRGWADYSRRFEDATISRLAGYREQKIPRWRGEDLRGKTILVLAEQGSGDSIQFIRYARLLKECGARVLFRASKHLVDLFDGVAGVDRIVSEQKDDYEEPVDYHTPLMDLPFRFGTTIETIPAQIPYLHANAEKVAHWRKQLPQDKFKVGLVWSGNPRHKADKMRSCRLEHFSALKDVPGAQFYSLQKGDAAGQLSAAPEGFRPIDLGRHVDSFADTAAVIVALDLVISVDTSVAHLTGAMGRPCWTLIAFEPDWRWLLEREDSPWYPGMRLFRQRRHTDWPEVVTRLRTALEAEVKAKR